MTSGNRINIRLWNAFHTRLFLEAKRASNPLDVSASPQAIIPPDLPPLSICRNRCLSMDQRLLTLLLLVIRFFVAGGDVSQVTSRSPTHSAEQVAHGRNAAVPAPSVVDAQAGDASSRWNEWTPWTPCNVSCLQSRSRTCSSVVNSDGSGDDTTAAKETCAGHRWERGICKGGECSRDEKDRFLPTVRPTPVYTWMEWTEWSPCSATCGDGATKTRERLCAMQSATNDGPSLPLPSTSCPRDGKSETRRCELEPCTVAEIRVEVLFRNKSVAPRHLVVDLRKEDRLILFCSRPNTSHSRLSWWKGDRELLPGGGDGRLTINKAKHAKRLRIRLTVESDEGHYSCVYHEPNGDLIERKVIKLSFVTDSLTSTIEPSGERSTMSAVGNELTLNASSSPGNDLLTDLAVFFLSATEVSPSDGERPSVVINNLSFSEVNTGESGGWVLPLAVTLGGAVLGCVIIVIVSLVVRAHRTKDKDIKSNDSEPVKATSLTKKEDPEDPGSPTSYRLTLKPESPPVVATSPLTEGVVVYGSLGVKHSSSSFLGDKAAAAAAAAARNSQYMDSFGHLRDDSPPPVKRESPEGCSAGDGEDDTVEEMEVSKGNEVVCPRESERRDDGSKEDRSDRRKTNYADLDVTALQVGLPRPAAAETTNYSEIVFMTEGENEFAEDLVHEC